MTLTGKQKRKLRALGHHLSPVVLVGQQGISDGVLSAAGQALLDHELIKIKLGEGVESRHEAALQLAGGTGSEVAQVLGRTVLLFKRREEDSKFEQL
jgi:RNA-binding protein